MFQYIHNWSEVPQSCLTLCNPMDCSLPGSSVHGIFQARILEWVAISFSSLSFRPRDGTWVSHLVGKRFTVWATREVISTRLGIYYHISPMFLLFCPAWTPSTEYAFIWPSSYVPVDERCLQILFLVLSHYFVGLFIQLFDKTSDS